MKKSYEIDMCNGPLWGKLLLFSIPLILSGILQLLFNAADIVVVGRFAGSHALAAVGSTSYLINFFINVFIGCSIGTNVLIGRYYGAKDEKNASETVHTSILLSIICGGILMVLGVTLAKPMLKLMGTPGEVLELASLYMRIFFVGMPALMLYNFGAAILRAIGDTQRPLYYLFSAGVVNVILNLFFVIVCRMSVAGVALATIISQNISAALILRCLGRMEGMCRMEWRKLRIHKGKMKHIIRIGLPAGVQGSVFSISNVVIQSSINSFGAVAMAGSTAAANLESFVYTAMNAVYQTALSFTSQNMGAGNHKRIGQILWRCLVIVTVIGGVLGVSSVIFAPSLLGIYSSDAQVIAYGAERMKIVCLPYFLCGIMDVLVGSLRGMGYSVMPTIVSLTGACGTRVLWVFTVFAWHPTLPVLFWVYPISWLITLCVHMICWLKARKIEKKKLETQTISV